MRVAIDEQIFAIQAHGGISRLFYELATEFVGNPERGVRLTPFDAPIVNEYVLRDPKIRQTLGAREATNAFDSLGRLARMRKPAGRPQLVHHTFYLPTALGKYRGIPRVVTVFDMIPELMRHTKRRLDFVTQKRRFLEKADQIICISHSTKSDLLRVWPDLQAPISVTYLGASDHFEPRGDRPETLPDRYILHVGTRSGYKDAWTLTEAFARIAADHPDVTLVYVGGGAPTADEAKQWNAGALRGRVQWMSPSEFELPAYYSNSECCVVPSRYEGFGLPALEGMACGAPQILSDTSSLPEVGGTAARYFTPGNIEQLASRMNEVLMYPDVRSSMRLAGLARSRDFTWRRCAEQTAQVYASAIDS
jgi:glycosyltransferase involved in cell wall biosynthesis